MAIEIKGRAAHEKQTTSLTVQLTARNDAILTALADSIHEKKAYIVNKLVAEIKLSDEVQHRVTDLLEATTRERLHRVPGVRHKPQRSPDVRALAAS